MQEKKTRKRAQLSNESPKKPKEPIEEKEFKKNLFPLYSYGNFKLFLFATFMVIWCTTYQKLMYSIYITEAWHLFDHFMKILINQASHKERPLSRNMVFNFMRCFFDEFLFYVIYETLPSTSMLIFRVLSVLVMTYLVQNHCGKKAIKRNADDWALLQLFYLTSFGIQFIYAISKVEDDFKSNIARTATMVIGLIMAYLFGDLVEDFFFDDIKRWGGIWHNWAFFGAPGTIIALAFFLAHFWIHHGKPRGALRHESGVMFSIQHYQMPLIWPSTHFTDNEDEHWLIVLMANSIYAYTTLYYCISWKTGLKKGKAKRVSEQLLENIEYQPNLSRQEEEKIRELEERMHAMKNLRPETDYDKHMAAKFAAYQ